MENDIDDLLDEVESKYVNRNKKTEESSKLKSKKTELSSTATTVTTGSIAHKGTALASTKPKARSVVDDAINDILDLDIEESSSKTKITASNSVTSVSSNGEKKTGTKKCFPIFLGGSKDEAGLGTTVKTRSCDRLRCTACDFRVCYFDDYSWKKDTNYLFLRNNVPDFDKLKTNLRRQKGCRAYCCQCSWRDIASLQEISDQNLKWVCGKHDV